MPARPGGNHLGTPPPNRRLKNKFCRVPGNTRLPFMGQGEGEGGGHVGLSLLFCRDQGPILHLVEPHG